MSSTPESPHINWGPTNTAAYWRWRLLVTSLGVVLACLAWLFPPYHLSRGLVVSGERNDDCSASVLRYATMPPRVAAAGPVFDSGTFTARLAVILITTLLVAYRKPFERPVDGPYTVRNFLGLCALFLVAWFLVFHTISFVRHPTYTIICSVDD